MLRDNLVELIEPMPNGAGADALAPGIHKQRQASDDRLSCLENPRPAGAESSLTENVTSPFPAEPAHSRHVAFAGLFASAWFLKVGYARDFENITCNLCDFKE